MIYPPQYHTACQIQRKILAAMGLDLLQRNQVPKSTEEGKKVKLKPSELCSLTAAWDKIEERKRILRMKPLPKAIEVKEKVRGPVHIAPREE